MVQHARNRDSVRDSVCIQEIEQDIRRRRRPTTPACRQFVARLVHFRLHQQRVRLGVNSVEEAIRCLDAVFGDIQPGFQQIVFRAGGMSNFSHAAAKSAAALRVLPDHVA